MAPEETHCPPAGGMQPASQYQQPAGLEHSAPKPATSVHGAASQGKLRRLQGLLPLPQTKRTPEKTPQAPPRHKNEMLRSLFGPLLYAADDVVEAYRRPATSQDQALAIAGPGQETPGYANSPMRMARGDLKMMGNDSSAQSGTSTHSHASADDALLLKRRQVSVTRCVSAVSKPAPIPARVCGRAPLPRGGC